MFQKNKLKIKHLFQLEFTLSIKYAYQNAVVFRCYQILNLGFDHLTGKFTVI